MKRSGDSIQHCRSPTPTLNGCEVTPSTRTQSSDLWHGPRISRKFVGERKFVLQCYGHDKNHTGYHPALVQLFSRHLGIHSSWEAKQRDAAVVGSFTPVSLFCVIGTINLLIFRHPSKTPCHLTHEAAKISSVPSYLIHYQTFHN